MENYFKDKKGLFWRALYEVILMFSNKPSLFSSKRFERFVMFNIAMWTVVGYVSRNWSKMDVSEVSVITGILLAGGAWNAVQIRKDTTLDKSTTNGNTSPATSQP